MECIRMVRWGCLFGSKALTCNYEHFRSSSSLSQLYAEDPYAFIMKHLGAKDLIFPRQVHGIKSLALLDKASVEQACSTHHEADIVLTKLRRVAIGVLTADCLPIVLYDPEVKALAVVHAGWRGSVAAIAPEAVSLLQMYFGTVPGNLQVYFGPSATVDAYSVGQELLDAVAQTAWSKQVIAHKDKNYFFNLPLLNELQLIEAGVLPGHIFKTFNRPTMTDTNYWSYRREKEAAQRQPTVAILY